MNKGDPLPPPNKLKRKNLIKNKRLIPEVEKEELEKYFKGELQDVNDDVISEDAAAEAAETSALQVHAGSTTTGELY